MILPWSCLHFGPIQNHNVTEGTSHQDRADKAKELKKWIRQQEEELRKLHGEEVEILPSPLLLQEMEETGLSLPTPVSPVLIPGRIRSCLPPTESATSTSSRRRRHRRGPSSSPTARAVSPGSPMAASTPTAAEFPAGFGSRPGRHCHRKTVAIGVVRMGASYPSTEGPQAMVYSRLFSPELGDGHSAPSAVLQPPVQPPAPSWIEAGLEEMKRKFMKNRCCGFVLHLMDHPEDLDLVHSLLQAEFLAVGWLDVPAPVSAGGPFDPLLVAVKAANPLDSQHAAKLTEPQPAAAGSTEPPHQVLGFPEGSEDKSPQTQAPDSHEGFEDEPPLTSAPEPTDFLPGMTDCSWHD
ncbi:hypothetical protein ATANTOWER_003963 [Ataeniobius toweri]|uniref:Uncharacterized protein n=1 Tax=Ataeniobius toweri TaxID=208326 RepID=A0ABU7BGJ4_9TELE|nr:hypothetical protein [Ataeniobius toweri]